MDNYRIFVETVKLLASSPDIQLASIPELACRPDEIAFCLEDIMPLIKDYVRDGIITKKWKKWTICLFRSKKKIGPK